MSPNQERTTDLPLSFILAVVGADDDEIAFGDNADALGDAGQDLDLELG